MSCEKSEKTLISLSDKLLLHIFKFLNWIDSINLATTCDRMKHLKYWLDKENQEFDFKKYVEKTTVSIENVLPVIGSYIRVAKITEPVLNKYLMEKCYNIKSLKIDESISQKAAVTLNTWMKQLKIESLSIGLGFENYVKELLDGIEGLNAFGFNSYQNLPNNFFYKNSTIQHLLLILGDEYDFSSLLVLQSLQSIFLQTERTGQLVDVQKYVKTDNVKEFSIFCLEDNWDADIWNRFVNHLAKKTKLDKLKLNGYNIFFDNNTFSTLQLFNLKSLWLGVDFSWNDFSKFLHENAAPRLKYLRLEWTLSWCSSEKIGDILKIWTTVEAICLNADEDSNHQLHFNETFFNDILEISDNRPGLRLHIFSSEVS